MRIKPVVLSCLVNTLFLTAISFDVGALTAHDLKTKPNLKITGVTWSNLKCASVPGQLTRTLTAAQAKVKVKNFSNKIDVNKNFQVHVREFHGEGFDDRGRTILTSVPAGRTVYANMTMDLSLPKPKPPGFVRKMFVAVDLSEQIDEYNEDDNILFPIDLPACPPLTLVAPVKSR